MKSQLEYLKNSLHQSRTGFVSYSNNPITLVHIKSQIRLFADDGIIYREINNDQDHVTLQEDLNNLNNWAKI